MNLYLHNTLLWQKTITTYHRALSIGRRIKVLFTLLKKR